MGRRKGGEREHVESVLKLFDANPGWTSGQIAVRLGMDARSGGGSVRSILNRNGRSLKRRTGQRLKPWEDLG